MKKQTWLVTGGAGFIGAHIARRLVELEQKVIIFDNFSSSSITKIKDIKSKVRVIKGDVRGFGALKKAFKNVDYVLHHAALVSVPRSVKEPALTQAVNVEGTFNVLLAAHEAGVKKVVFASSAAVYGNGKKTPYKETSATDCRSPYAASKLMGEELCKMFYNVYGLNTVALRYFNVYGQGQSASSPYSAVIAKFTDFAKNSDTFNIDWDGKQSRDFVFVADIVAANLLAAEKGKGGEVYNVSGGKTLSLLTLAGVIEKVYGKKMKRKFCPKRAGDVKDSSADTSKIKKLGFRAKVGLLCGLKAIKDAENV